MMKNIKKLLTIGIFMGILGIGYFPVYGEGINNGRSETVAFPFNPPHTRISCDDSGECTELPDEVDIKRENSIINRLLEVFGLNSDTFDGDHKFIYYVKGILNLALGLLSLIALVMTIYTFYMMFFSDNDAGIKKAKGNLVGIFIALAIIGLSWLVVSFVFRWYQSNWQNSLPQSY